MADIFDGRRLTVEVTRAWLERAFTTAPRRALRP
jgi:hypothetical protein